MNMHRWILTFGLAAVVSGPASGQLPTPAPTPQPGDAAAATPAEPAQPAPAPTPQPPAVQTEDVEAPEVVSEPAEEVPSPTPLTTAGGEGSGSFPGFNIYLPEGQFDITVRRLIKNVLFEGQVEYNFVDGDVSTFLRYKYYAKSYTYKLGIFDSIEFESIDDPSGDFDRTRGAFLQVEYPSNYDSRYFFLTQGDRLLFGDVDNPDNTNDNIYLKLGYQFGTPFDERLNSIVGETRGRITPVLTTYRDLGRQRLGLAIGLTHSLEAVGDYTYTKLEAELIKRFDLGTTTFLVSRLHAGTFLAFDELPSPPDLEDEDLLEQPTHLFTVPRYEYFRLGGRDAMKGLDSDSRGTDEAHLSNELFAPIFRNRNFRTGSLYWTNLYGIVYSGVGSVGFDSDEATALAQYEFGDLVVDVGLGIEASARYRDTELIISAIYAQTVKSPERLDSSEIRAGVVVRR